MKPGCKYDYRLNDEQRQLVEQWSRLVWRTVHKNAGQPWMKVMDRPDQFQVGMIGLCKAAYRWDGTRNFASFACPFIFAELRNAQDYCSLIRTYWNKAAGKRDFPTFQANGFDLNDIEAQPEPDADAAASSSVLGLLDALPEKLRTVVVECVMHGRTQQAVKDEIGCPRNSVFALKTSALAKLRTLCRSAGITWRSRKDNGPMLTTDEPTTSGRASSSHCSPYSRPSA